MRISHGIIAATVIVIAATAFAAKDLTTVQVALNQVGYLPTDQKIALVETNRDLIGAGAVARVLVQPGATPALADIALAVDRAARWQLDFLFGRNPFGVSLQAGAGSVYPLNPHHQVAALLPAAWYAPGNIVGSLAGGLAKKSQYPWAARRRAQRA